MWGARPAPPLALGRLHSEVRGLWTSTGRLASAFTGQLAPSMARGNVQLDCVGATPLTRSVFMVSHHFLLAYKGLHFQLSGLWPYLSPGGFVVSFFNALDLFLGCRRMSATMELQIATVLTVNGRRSCWWGSIKAWWKFGIGWLALALARVG